MKDLKKLKKRLYSLASMGLVTCYTMATAYADDAVGAKTEADANTAFVGVFGYVANWVSKGALAVAFVGAIMLGFAIKNNDAEQKQNAILTLVAGGVVAAVCGMLSTFGLGK